MKRFIAFTLALVLAFSSAVPVFAQEEGAGGPISLEPNAPVVTNDVSDDKVSKPDDEISVEDPESLGTNSGISLFTDTTISSQDELYAALNGGSGVYTLDQDITLTSPYVANPDLSVKDNIVIVGNGHSIVITGGEWSADYMLGARPSTFGVLFQDITFRIDGNITKIAAIQTGYRYNNVTLTLTNFSGVAIEGISSNSSAFTVEASVVGPSFVFGEITASGILSNVDISRVDAHTDFSLAQIVNGTVRDVIYTGSLKTYGDACINLISQVAGATAVVEDVTFLNPLAADFARFRIVDQMNTGAHFTNIVLPEFLSDTMIFENFYRTLVDGPVGSIDVYVLAESMRSNCVLDTSKISVSGLYMKPVYSLEFSDMTVGTVYTKALDLTSDQASAFWDSSRLRVTGITDGSMTYELRTAGGSYELCMTLNSDTQTGGYITMNTYHDGYYKYPNVYGMWEQVSTPCQIPYEIQVTWTRGAVPVSDINAAYPAGDGSTVMAFSHRPFAWQAYVIPATSTFPIVAGTKTPDIISVDGNVVTMLKPGFAVLTYTAGDFYKEVSFVIDSTIEYEWEQRVLDIVPPITLQMESDLLALKTELDGLNRADLSESTLNLFNSYLDQLQVLIDSQPYKQVESLIDALPEAEYVALSHEQQINQAKAAYDALASDQKSEVSSDRVTKLEDVCARLQALKDHRTSVETVLRAIEDLPNPSDVLPEHEAIINQAAQQLADLDNAAGGTESGIHQDARTKLSDCQKAITAWKSAEADADALHARVIGLPPLSEVTLSTKEIVDGIKEDWDSATEKVKYFLDKKYADDLVTLQKYYDRITELEEEEFKKTAEAWNAHVLSLDVGSITLASRTTVDELQSEYDGFNEVTKKYVTQQALSRLKQLQDKLSTLQFQVDTREAEKVIQLIEKLPEKDKVVLNDEVKLKEARAAYEALTEAQKKLVSNYTKLTENEAELAALEKAKSTAEAFEKEVSNLPSKDKLTLESFKLVQSLHKKFLEFDEYVIRCLADSTKLKIVELYNETVKMANAVIQSTTYGFTMKGLIGVSPKLYVKMPVVDKDVSTYTSVKSKLEQDSGKELLVLYQMDLSGGVDGNPFSTVEVTFPVPTFYNDHTDVGLVEYDAASGKINYVKPEIVTIDGQQYFKYNTAQADYVGVVAAKKSFAWIYSFFGRSIVSISYKDLDSYNTTPGKVNPVMGDL